MPEPELFFHFLPRLNALGIRYMVTGSVASIIYGEPRLTHDVDLILALQPEDIDRFVAAFPPEEYYCPPPEVIMVEVRRLQRGHFNLIHQKTGFKADVYLAGRDELHLWALNNRKKETVGGEDFWVAPVEYVIVRKLEYYREGGSEKHVRDIAGIIAISSNLIDTAVLDKLVGGRGLEKEWEKANNFAD